jgi:hypothetical protein
MRILSLATCSLFLLTSTSAFALQQSEPEVEPVGTQVYEMDPMGIGGTRLDPDGQQTVVRTNARFHSLLTIRASFNDEIIKSANDPALQ